MRRREIPITYSRIHAPKLTQCDLIRQLQDTIQDSELVERELERLQLNCSPHRGHIAAPKQSIYLRLSEILAPVFGAGLLRNFGANELAPDLLHLVFLKTLQSVVREAVAVARVPVLITIFPSEEPTILDELLNPFADLGLGHSQLRSKIILRCLRGAFILARFSSSSARSIS